METKLFKELAIGDKFKKVHPPSKHYSENGETYEIYQKTTKSTATCIKQIGFGNTRAVGGIFKYGPCTAVFVENA